MHLPHHTIMPRRLMQLIHAKILDISRPRTRLPYTSIWCSAKSLTLWISATISRHSCRIPPFDRCRRFIKFANRFHNHAFDRRQVCDWFKIWLPTIRPQTIVEKFPSAKFVTDNQTSSMRKMTWSRIDMLENELTPKNWSRIDICPRTCDRMLW